MRSRTVLGLAVAALLAVAWGLPAAAHHAHGNYKDEMVDMEGVVSEMHLINPHSWIYVTIPDAAGQPRMWALEAGGPQQGGPRKEQVLFKVGDKVKVRCHPLRDGTPGCLMGFMKSPDGTIQDWDSFTNKDLPKDF